MSISGEKCEDCQEGSRCELELAELATVLLWYIYIFTTNGHQCSRPPEMNKKVCVPGQVICYFGVL